MGVAWGVVDSEVVEEGVLGIRQAVLFGPVYVFSQGCGFGAGKTEVCDFESVVVALCRNVVAGDVERRIERI